MSWISYCLASALFHCCYHYMKKMPFSSDVLHQQETPNLWEVRLFLVCKRFLNYFRVQGLEQRVLMSQWGAYPLKYSISEASRKRRRKCLRNFEYSTGEKWCRIIWLYVSCLFLGLFLERQQCTIKILNNFTTY